MGHESTQKTWWEAREVRKEAQISHKVASRLVREGVVSSPGRGPNAGWSLEGRIRVLAAVALRKSGVHNPALKEQIDASTPAQLRALAGLPPEPGVVSQPVTDVPGGPSTWLRVPVAAGVELHVDVSRADGSKVAAMIKALSR